MLLPDPTRRLARLLIIPVIGLTVAACGAGTASLGSNATVTAAPARSAAAPTSGAASTAGSSPSGSSAPEASGAPAGGDIPDNAVFLTYHATNPAFSIQYVEGWQVTPQLAGVVIRDKDSSETVAVVASQADVASYVTTTDLPALGAQAGFSLTTQDTVQAGGAKYRHVAYHVTSSPDPVTGKQVPMTVDRYYVPGPGGLAIISLASPDGVDNVDAFRQMIESFRWS